ncbi:replication initiation protein [Domibacillus indicus]|uniref:replication initiation protein n=1 Tax=Domibacillus indicus TaxID=1437523 RepID=UPI0006180807|nr:replication initiation protein [Domibacillus indicus]
MKNRQLSFEDDMFEANIKPEYWVNQSTSLINMAQNLTVTERRIIYSLIALIQPDDRDFKTYVLSVKDLAQLIGYKGKSFYSQVEKAIDGIMQKQITIYSTDGKQRVVDKIQWVQQATYFHGNGQVKIKLSDALAEYLLNLEKFTKYRLINVLRLNSEYSWRIYEFLKEDEWKSRSIIQKETNKKWKSHRIMYVKELRQLLDIPDDTLKLMKHFRATVLEKAKKELNEKTDIEFDYEVHTKKGRRIESFIFYINPSQRFQDLQTDVDSTMEQVQSLVNVLIKNGVRGDAAIKLAGKYHYDYLRANIRYVITSTSSKKNHAGYIISAVKENYADYKGPAEKTEKDPFYNLILGQVEQRLKQMNERDNKALEQIVKRHEKMLLENPDADIKQIIESRKSSVMSELDKIETVRNKQNHPSLSEEDISNQTVKDIFSEWKAQIIDVDVY